MVRTRCPWSWYLWAREAMSCELKSIIPKASHENGWRSMAHSTRCIRSPEAGDSAGVASDWLRRRTSPVTPVTSFPKISKTSSKISSNQPTKALTMDSMESMEPAESALLRRHEPGRVGLGWTTGMARAVGWSRQAPYVWCWTVAVSKVISGQIYNLQVLVPPELWNYHDAVFQPPDWELPILQERKASSARM